MRVSNESTVKHPLMDPPKSGQPPYNGQRAKHRLKLPFTQCIYASEKRRPLDSGQRTLRCARKHYYTKKMASKSGRSRSSNKIITSYYNYNFSKSFVRSLLFAFIWILQHTYEPVRQSFITFNFENYAWSPCMHVIVNLSEEDNLPDKDKTWFPKVSFIRRFHCIIILVNTTQ